MPFSITVSPTQELEDYLAAAGEPGNRLRLIEQLVSVYVYGNPERSRRLLAEWDALLNAEGLPHPFRYHLHRASLAGQRYDPETAYAEINRALELVQEQGDLAEQAEVYLDYIGLLINRHELSRAWDTYERVEKLLAGFKPRPGLRARAHCRQGYLHLHSFSYAKATPEFLLADKLLAEERDLTAKDHYFYTLIHSGHGTLLTTRPNQTEAAAEAFRKAIDRCEERQMTARLPWHRLALGVVLLRRKDYGEAREIFESIIDSRANGSKSALAQAYDNLALCYYNLDVAAGEITRLLNEAEQLYRAQDPLPRSRLIGLELQRAQLFHAEDDREGAIEKLLTIISEVPEDVSENNHDLTGQMADTLTLLARCYAEEGDYRSAYECEVQYNVYVKRYNELQDVKKQERYVAQFEAEARKQERESLQLRASQLQLRALRAQMNPHFMYNALNSIQSFITQNDASTASRYLAKFAMLMRRSLEYSNREYITLEDEVRFLKDYLDINCNLRFQGRVKFNVQVDPRLEDDIIGVPTMILQPYVENAVEHGLQMANSGHITVAFTPIAGDDDNILATVTDNGIGRAAVAKLQAADTTRAEHESRGTSITESRLELLGADTTGRVLIEDLYDDGVAAGTRVTVRIPVN